MQNKIQIEMEKALSTNKDEAESDLHQWLSVLSNYFEYVIDLTEELEEYQIKELDLKESIRFLFSDYFREFFLFFFSYCDCSLI